MENYEFAIVSIVMMGIVTIMFIGILVMLFVFKREYKGWNQSIRDIKQAIIDANKLFTEMKNKI